MFNTFLYQPLLTTLVFFTNLLGGSFGLAILALTVLTRTLLIPLSLPSMRSAQKLQILKPEIKSLKKKYGHDKKLLQREQLELYKKHGINPAAGCLPTLVQLAILIALYKVFIDFIQNGNGDVVFLNMRFLWLDLAKPDPYYILPLLAGVSQLLLSKMLMGGREHHKEGDLKESVVKKEKKAQEPSEESAQDMAETLQQQMLYVMPAMTALIALSLPSGLAVYWVATTIFSFIQQLFVSGPGGLTGMFKKIPSAKEV